MDFKKIAEEIWYLAHTLNELSETQIRHIEQALKQVREETIEECAGIAETEEEPKLEDLPTEMLEVFLKSPAHSLIGSIISTKKNIEKRIRELKGKAS